MNLSDFAKEVHENARIHGWWSEERSFGEIIALCHSELSEALEAYRSGMPVDKVVYRFDDCGDMTKDECAGCYNGNPKCVHAKPDGVPAELADCIIRILDYCGKEGIDIEDVIRRKHEYNKTRPYRHGGKIL